MTRYTSDQVAFIITEIDRLRNEGYTSREAAEVVAKQYSERFNVNASSANLLGKYYREKEKRSPDIHGDVKKGHKIVLVEEDKQWAQVFDDLETAMKHVNGALSRYKFYEAAPIKLRTKTVTIIER